MADLRSAVVVGGNRIPFGRIGGAYASATNLDMLTAAIDGLRHQPHRGGATEQPH